MTLSEAQVRQVLMQFPGKRGIDVPADVYDRIFDVASGIARPLWGRPPRPEQMQWLHDNGHHEPDQIHAAFGDLQHPHAPDLKVGEYDAWAQAHQVYTEHSK